MRKSYILFYSSYIHNKFTNKVLSCVRILVWRFQILILIWTNVFWNFCKCTAYFRYRLRWNKCLNKGSFGYFHNFCSWISLVPQPFWIVQSKWLSKDRIQSSHYRWCYICNDEDCITNPLLCSLNNGNKPTMYLWKTTKIRVGRGHRVNKNLQRLYMSTLIVQSKWLSNYRF